MEAPADSLDHLSKLATEYWQQKDSCMSKGDIAPPFDLMFSIHEARANNTLAAILEKALVDGQLHLAALICATPSPFANSTDASAIDLLEARLSQKGLAVIVKSVSSCKESLPESLIQQLVKSIHSAYSAKREVFNKYTNAAIKSLADEAFETNNSDNASRMLLKHILNYEAEQPCDLFRLLARRAMSSMWDSVIEKAFPVAFRTLENALHFRSSVDDGARALVDGALTYSVEALIDDQVTERRCNSLNEILLDGHDALSEVRLAVIKAVNEAYDASHYLAAALDLADLCVPASNKLADPFNKCDAAFLSKGVRSGDEVVQLRKVKGFDMSRLDVHALPIMGKRAIAEYEWGI